MVVVNRFRWFGWFVLCVGVILGCYLMSSRVAAERNKLADVERAIATTQRDIRALETEFDTRANLAQLQRWNGDTLKLSAPTAAQYVRDDAQLAMLDSGQPQVQNAAVIPSAPAATIETTPASVTVTVAPAAAPKAKPAVATTVAVVKPAAKPRAQMAMLDRRIMGGSSLGDLMRRVGADGSRQ
ncbi:hypothetical protein FPZ24_11220 [Sphingomonas panacisoli]|uniref:Colicin transporter n=1 Tax=Sphingomonas panacisoli TaxID=1813879 RepID=A0A5B8LIJ3_9SPHN|nr:hypothetical protein [Sphingomonas panacisoli]QDZ07983.1 hypothetical protein FPZ24_11220 [Sphingomonas panacisoli]